MPVERITYRVNGKNFIGALIHDDRIGDKRPLMLIAPNWLGVNEAVIKRTQAMTGSRYIGFVADMYGDGKNSAGPPEAAELANALRADVKERRLRISAAMSAFVEESNRRGIGNTLLKAAVGFCFGGGNVLELARTGVDLQAAVSVHGDLTTPLLAAPGAIKAALLVLHGAADPIAPKAQRDVFESEMEAAKAKWQMVTFGHVVHSFCEAESNVPGIAEYNEPAARQAYRLIDAFIADAFERKL
jgi:dienelactone hydrolase